MKLVLTLRCLVDTPKGHPLATVAFEVPEWKSAYEAVPGAAHELVEQLTRWMAKEGDQTSFSV